MNQKKNKFFKRVTLFIVLLFITASSSKLLGQEFKNIDKERPLYIKKERLFKLQSKNLLVGEGISKLTKIENSIKAKNVQVVELPDSLYSVEELTFNINPQTESITFDNSGVSISIKRTGIDILSDTEIAWKGIIQPSNGFEEIGNATFIVNDRGQITGTIDVDGIFYEIRSLGQGKIHALRAVKSHVKNTTKKDLYSTEKDRTPNKEVHTYPIRHTSTSGSPCSNNVQQVLVVYTQNAENAVADIDATISLAMQETNEAYDNSNISNVEITLAHKQQVAFTETSLQNDIFNLKNSITVENLRNQHDADIVVLLTDGSYGSGSIRGWANSVPAQDTTAYSIVEAEHATGSDYTFAHEVGHLQGAHHHPDDPDNPMNSEFSYGYGHRFSYKPFLKDRRYRSTVMAGRPLGNDPGPGDEPEYYSRVKHFSNPYVQFRDKDTGIANERENWKAIRTTNSTIASFKGLGGIYASINVVSGDVETGEFDFSGSSCTVPPSTYEWQISFNSPFSYGGVVETGASFNYDFPPGEHSIKLTVTKNGQSSIAYESIVVNGDGGPGGGGPGGNSKVLLNEESEEITDFKLNAAYPNPFNPSTTISFELAEANNVNLSVYNLIGNEVAVLENGRLKQGAHSYTFDASNLSSGTYIVRLQTNDFLNTQKITLVK